MKMNDFIQAMQNLWVYRGPNQQAALKEYVKTLSGFGANWAEVFAQLKITHKTTSWPTIGTIAEIAKQKLIEKPKTNKLKRSMTEKEIFIHPIGQGCLKKGLGLVLSDFVGQHKRFPNKEEGAGLKPFGFDKSEFRGKFLQTMLDREKWSKNKEGELKAKYLK